MLYFGKKMSHLDNAHSSTFDDIVATTGRSSKENLQNAPIPSSRKVSGAYTLDYKQP
jgi:hypothetical protein